MMASLIHSPVIPQTTEDGGTVLSPRNGNSPQVASRRLKSWRAPSFFSKTSLCLSGATLIINSVSPLVKHLQTFFFQQLTIVHLHIFIHNISTGFFSTREPR